MNKIAFAILFFFFALTANKKSVAQAPQKQVTSQKQTFLLDGKITLDSLTKFIHHRSGVRFSFNSVKVKGSREIIFPRGSYSLSDILQRIRKTTSLYYTFYSGYVVFQDTPPKQTQKKLVAKKNPSETGNKHPKKIGGKAPVKKSIPKNQSNERKNIARQKPENKAAATDSSLNGGIVKSQGNIQTPNPAKAGMNTGDSVKTVAPDKNPIAIQEKKDSVLKGSAKIVSVDSTISGTISNQNSTAASAKKNTRAKNRKPINLHYGLQWNLNIPLYSLDEYFTGTNGKNQFYNLFIPGVWVSKTIGTNNNELILLLKPEQQYLTGNKTMAIATGPFLLPDTSLSQRKTNIIKTNGVYAGLQYNFHINDKWSIGGGINVHWQTSALARQRTTRLSTGILLIDSLYGIKKSSSDWQYLKSTFFSTRLEAAYSFKKLQLGGTILIPFANILSSPLNNSYSINGHVFLRWRIK